MTLHLKHTLFNILLLIMLPIFCVFVFSDNTFADSVEDISVTIPAETSLSQWSDVFSNCTGDCLNDYSYLIIDGQPYDTSSSGAALRIFFRANGSNGYALFVSGDVSYAVYSLPFDGHSNNYFQWGNNYSFNNDVTLTLTNSLPSNTPDCPEPPAPEPCDCDDAFIVGLFKDSFWNVATAIVSLIVPVLALFLLFRLVHGLMFGKGL